MVLCFSIWSNWFDYDFFSWLFCKSYYSFQYYPSIKTLFLIFMTILILIILSIFGPFTKLIFLFNFTLQSNIKFILFFNFDPHSFKCYFFNPFTKLKFFFQSHHSIFDWLKIRFHGFFRFDVFGSNDLSHKFEKLTQFFFKQRLYNSLFFYQVNWISWFGLQV